MDLTGPMQINGYTLPPRTLKHLAGVLGEGRTNELQEIASNICQTEAQTADERIVLAEFFRLSAELAAGREGPLHVQEEEAS